MKVWRQGHTLCNWKVIYIWSCRLYMTCLLHPLRPRSLLAPPGSATDGTGSWCDQNRSTHLSVPALITKQIRRDVHITRRQTPLRPFFEATSRSAGKWSHHVLWNPIFTGLRHVIDQCFSNWVPRNPRLPENTVWASERNNGINT